MLGFWLGWRLGRHHRDSADSHRSAEPPGIDWKAFGEAYWEDVATFRGPVPAESAIPAELRSLDRWVRYSSRKAALTVTGGAASSTNPATWSTYAEAVASKTGAGLGFVLNGDGLCCIDLDHCLVDGKPNGAARRFLAKLPRTYIEVSPSGEGLHVWGRAAVPTGRRVVVDGLSVDVYGVGRYMTVTGKPYAVRPLADLSAVVANIA